MNYLYCVMHENKLLPYSGRFKTKTTAKRWHDNPFKGAYLRYEFNRDLILCKENKNKYTKI